MDARIEELQGKYYGTIVTYYYDTGWGSREEREIEVWDMGDYTPSERQLEKWEMTLEEARKDMMCDSHYESAQSFRIASAILDALSKLETGEEK